MWLLVQRVVNQVRMFAVRGIGLGSDIVVRTGGVAIPIGTVSIVAYVTWLLVGEIMVSVAVVVPGRRLFVLWRLLVLLLVCWGYRVGTSSGDSQVSCVVGTCAIPRRH
jgi:hypothetical protein